MPQPHFEGKRLKRKKERATMKALNRVELSAVQFMKAMDQLANALKQSAKANGAFYKSIFDAYPHNFRHKKKLMNRKY
jgi:hypothetical protein